MSKKELCQEESIVKDRNISRIEQCQVYIFDRIKPCQGRNNVKERALLKGPKHDQVGYEFFYIKQTRMVR